ncbi:NUDIX domain-containing protein [Pseudomonas sp.]|uniref:NUDIX domain-containing protein n=1 Tax=Pseudomonas sp. TaxID=306 RepID=UPI0026273593|nr:NUDIX domain-containing protein [Pseudomonas sp.]
MHTKISADTSAPLDAGFEVVAGVLTHRGRLGLFRRSALVSGNVGQWHCITGFLPAGADPLNHVLLEIQEELGISASNLLQGSAAIVNMHDHHGNCWCVHAFHFESMTESVELNWENDGACWVFEDQLESLPTVNWLSKLMCQLPSATYR